MALERVQRTAHWDGTPTRSFFTVFAIIGAIAALYVAQASSHALGKAALTVSAAIEPAVMTLKQ